MICPQLYKIQKMCNKAASTYPSTIQFVPDRFKTQEMCDRAVGTCPFVFNSVPGSIYNSKIV